MSDARTCERLHAVAMATPREPVLGITMAEARQFMGFDCDAVPVNGPDIPMDSGHLCKLFGRPCIILDLPPGYRLRDFRT